MPLWAIVVNVVALLLCAATAFFCVILGLFAMASSDRGQARDAGVTIVLVLLGAIGAFIALLYHPMAVADALRAFPLPDWS